MKYPGSIENDPEKGKSFEIIATKEELSSIGRYENEEILGNKGVLVCQYSSGICLLSVKIKFHDIQGIIHDIQMIITKDKLRIIN